MAAPKGAKYHYKGGRDSYLNVRINSDVKERARLKADDLGLTLSDYIEKLIESDRDNTRESIE